MFPFSFSAPFRSLFPSWILQQHWHARTGKPRAKRYLTRPEMLETRQLLVANLSVLLDQGELTVSDVAQTPTDDSLQVSISGSNLVITSALNQFIDVPDGGSLTPDGRILTVPLNLITQGLAINAGQGDDFVGVEDNGVVFNANIAISGDEGNDLIVLGMSPQTIAANNIYAAAESVSVAADLTSSGYVNLVGTGNDSIVTLNANVTAGADSTFLSDHLAINGNVDVGSHQLTLTPESTADAGDAILIGPGSDDMANTLQLSNDELNRITAGTIAIGDNLSGTVTVTGQIQLSHDSNVQIFTGGNAAFVDGSSWTTANGNLSVTANLFGKTSGTFFGLDLDHATVTSTGSGNIDLGGRGGDSGSFDVGLFLRNGTVVQSTGTGKITLEGAGGTGDSDNRGVEIYTPGTTVSSVSGDIEINGTGGDGQTASDIGVWLVDGAHVTATGTASIKIDGRAGGGAYENSGVLFNGFGYFGDTQVTAENGNISIVGIGPATATDARNRGVGIFEGTSIASTGTGAISILGVGGAGTNEGMGVEIGNVGTKITTVNGNLLITGFGGANSSAYGIWMHNGAALESTGNGSITLQGTGGDAHDGNGIILDGSGNNTSITSNNGDITLIGKGGKAGGSDTARGVGIFSGTQITSTGTAKISITGTGGLATDAARGVEIADTGTEVTNAAGDIEINGAGGTGVYAFGTWIRSGAVVETHAAGKLTIHGTGGTGGTDQTGVIFNGYGNGGATLVASEDGDMDLIGIGGNSGTGAADRGIGAFEGATIQSTGLAKITLSGTAGNGASDEYGVELADGGTLITSSQGDILITGLGGTSTATRTYNMGVWIRDSASIISTGTNDTAAKIIIDGTGGVGSEGNIGVWMRGAAHVASIACDISVTGQGAVGTGAFNYGLDLQSGSTITSSGAAKVTIDGAGGAGSKQSQGVFIESNSLVQVVDGDLQITGHGGDGGDSNLGVGLQSGGVAESTGAARITINGTAGTGTDYNDGVRVLDPGSAVRSVTGDIQITGQGGAATDIFSHGVDVENGGTVVSKGTARISVSGTGGVSQGRNVGVYVVGADAAIRSVDGDIQINGTGGTNGESDDGVGVQEGGSIESTGAAKVNISGVGGQGTASSNNGVRIYGANAFIRSTDGDIQVTGVGGTGTTFNSGVDLQVGGAIIATGNASIRVTGTGGTGVFGTGANVGQVGVWLLNAESEITANNGDIQIIGTGGGDPGSTGNHGVVFQSGVIQTVAGGTSNVSITGTAGVGSTSFGISANSDSATTAIDTSAGAGTITLTSDSLYIDYVSLPAAINAGTKTVTIQPKTSGTQIKLGSDDAANVLGLSDGELDRITAGTLQIGNATSGPLTVTADITRPTATNVELISAGDQVLAGQIDTAGGTLSLAAGPITHSIQPTHSGVDIIASSTDLNGALAIVINGTAVDSGYTQLNVIGAIDLTGQNLVLTGAYVPAVGDQFVIVNNDGSDPITGTWNGLPEGASLNFNGRHMRISYVGGASGNDVTLTAVNDVPKATDISILPLEDTPYSGTLAATDSDSPVLTYSIETQPAHGTVSITNTTTGAYLYTPSANYNGTDSFQYKANDGLADSNFATVSITVQAVNDAPQASDLSISTMEDGPCHGTLLATDNDSPTLSYSIVAQPEHGTVTITNSALGAYIYTPSANYNGTDSFQFKANDGSSDSNVATVSITIQSVNDAPQLTPGEGTVTFSAKAERGGHQVILLPGVIVTDPDQSAEFGVGGGTLTISVDASGKSTKKNLKLDDTFGGLSNGSTLGTTTGPAFANNKLVLSIHLNPNTTTAAVQDFLQSLTFRTKGAGLKLTPRVLHVQLTDAAGATSNVLERTLNVTR
jgi:hypothetical protein